MYAPILSQELVLSLLNRLIVALIILLRDTNGYWSDASLLCNLRLLRWHLLRGLALGRRWLTWLSVRYLLSSVRLRIHQGLAWLAWLLLVHHRLTWLAWLLLVHHGLTWLAWLLLWNLHVHLLAGLSWLLVHHWLALSSWRTLCMRAVHGLRDLSLLPSLLLNAADDNDDNNDRDNEADSG